MAAEAHNSIRTEVATLPGAEVAGPVRILYGGSVKPDSFEKIVKD
jgi:triosephosphate isomerase